jgi:hypothetical protein
VWVDSEQSPHDVAVRCHATGRKNKRHSSRRGLTGVDVFVEKKGGSPAFVLLRDAAFEDMKPCINDPSRKNEHHLAEQDGYVAEPAEVWLVE